MICLKYSDIEYIFTGKKERIKIKYVGIYSIVSILYFSLSHDKIAFNLSFTADYGFAEEGFMLLR